MKGNIEHNSGSTHFYILDPVRSPEVLHLSLVFRLHGFVPFLGELFDFSFSLIFIRPLISL